MGQENFKKMLAVLQKSEDPVECIKKRDKELFFSDELLNYAVFLQN